MRAQKAEHVMRQLYRPLYLIEKPVLFTSLETAELIKYAANAFWLSRFPTSTKWLIYVRKWVRTCMMWPKVWASIKELEISSCTLAQGMAGHVFLKTRWLWVRTAEDYDSPVSIVTDVVAYNQARKRAMPKRVISAFSGNVTGRKIAILGLALSQKQMICVKARPLRLLQN